MRRISAYGPSVVVLFTAVVVLIVGPHAVRVLTDAQTEARIIRASSRLTDHAAILDQLNQAYQDIATVVEPSVVHISAQRERSNDFPPGPRLSTGSGWVWDELGHVVTNYHVIEGANIIDVQLYNGTTRRASVVGVDELTDIAVLHIESGGLFPAQSVDNNYDVQQGDMVFAFGSPFDFRFSMSSGVVSGKGRSVGVIRPFGVNIIGYENFIQVDAAINPGNSGGPLTNHRGEVIGMNTAIATRHDGGIEDGQFAGIGLAIPMNMIEPVVSQVIDNNGVVLKGYLGVQPVLLVDESLEKMNRLGLEGDGVLIALVTPNSPAATGGVLAGDVVTHVNTSPIRTTQQLRSIISSMRPGDSIDLKVWRPDLKNGTGTSMSLPITLNRLDEVLIQGRIPTHHPTNHLLEMGIERMATSTEQLARQQNVEYYSGVMVESTVEGSDAALFLQPGSIIDSAFDYEVRSVEEFLDVLRKWNVIRGIRVTVRQPDGTRSEEILRPVPQ